jgi:Protein of unknown function (DUF2550)
MRVVEVIGIAVLILLGALLVLYVRREIISHAGGTIHMNLRLSTYVAGRGWAPGVGRFIGDELRWYRLFSFGLRPRRILFRHGLVVEGRRAPEGPEKLAMPEGWVVVRCRGRSGHDLPGRSGLALHGAVELALAESALNGFLSWLESAPPGALRAR